MRRISATTRGEIEWVKDYLQKQYVKGKNPPDNILEWQYSWFKHKTYPEVYNLIHKASIDLAKGSKGRIQFRHNLLQDKWRFHEGLDDYLMIHFGTQQRIAGHMYRQEVDWGYSSVLIPRIEDEIFRMKVPVLNVGKMKVSELKQKYVPSKK